VPLGKRNDRAGSQNVKREPEPGPADLGRETLAPSSLTVQPYGYPLKSLKKRHMNAVLIQQKTWRIV
jgi:hypothetical protein